ncbi:esterase-like activity of phytase family protein [Endozoicomonas sp. 8E]|uniref:esterase-like activity of phytase family protein n=1 Tax=Endozoicomonas sp. 8E TaxID=3035692 RepID=UPI002939009F|nr:esterase-like activity of phytase family protein [Endozoicomonas sp. 8E]WOG29021.1 hypothetical protein P6910_04985 [Endozoicomonas sp. 8E]
MMKRRSALVGLTLCLTLSTPGWSAESPGKLAPHKSVKYLGSHLLHSDDHRGVTHITGAHFAHVGNGSTGTLYLLSGDAGAGFTGRYGWGVFSKPHYYEVDLSRVVLDRQSPGNNGPLPSEVFEYQITEGKNAKTHPIWLNDGHIAPSAITLTKDGELMISSSQSNRGLTGIIDYRAIDIPAYAGFGYRHANRDETSLATRNNGFLKAWYDAHEFFPVPVLDLIPAAFLHTFREIPLQLSKGVHRVDIGLSSKFLLTNNDRRPGQVDSEFKLPKHFENNNWIPFHIGLKGIQQGFGVKSLDRVRNSNHYVAATAGALVQDAKQWNINEHVPPVRVVTFTTEQLSNNGQPLPGQYLNSHQLPARGEVTILSEKLYNFSLLVLSPSTIKQLGSSGPIRTVSDIAVLNKKQALFLEKTELPYRSSQSSFITRVYLVDLGSGKNFKGTEMFAEDELNKAFTKAPEYFMSKTLLFDSLHLDSLKMLEDKIDFDIHETSFEAIALGPETVRGVKTFMLVSYDDGENKKSSTATRLLHFTLPASK